MEEDHLSRPTSEGKEIIEIIRLQEKAKLVILNELLTKDMDWFEISSTISEKYYDKEFKALPFIDILESQGIIKKKQDKFEIANRKTCSKVLAANKKEIDRILSLDYGRGDFAHQLIEQEKHIFRKVLSFGNSVDPSVLYDAIFDDIDHGIGPFHGYASSSYGKRRAKEITANLMKRRFLKLDGSVSIPDRVLSDFVIVNSNELVSSLKEVSEKIEYLDKENIQLSSNVQLLKTEIAKWDPKSVLEALEIPKSIRRRIDKAISRIDQASFSEAIINCYLVSETLANTLFNFLYPNLKDKRIKHEDKLKRIWNDEKREKHDLPGIKVIASLLSVILWYRNKMGAHLEMTPTKEAARISVASLIQALSEFERLGIKIDVH